MIVASDDGDDEAIKSKSSKITAQAIGEANGIRVDRATNSSSSKGGDILSVSIETGKASKGVVDVKKNKVIVVSDHEDEDEVMKSESRKKHAQSMGEANGIRVASVSSASSRSVGRRIEISILVLIPSSVQQRPG